MTRHTDRDEPSTERSDRAAATAGSLGRRLLVVSVLSLMGLALTPVASAHGGHVAVNGVHLSQWYGMIPLVLGVAIAIGSRYLPRVLRPAYAKYALSSVFAGLAVAVFGAIWIVQLSPYEWFRAQPLIPRSVHEPLLLFLGVSLMLVSVIGVQRRWPLRPRYAGLGVLLSLWVAYPGFTRLGLYTPDHPLGYLIVLALPVALGYVLRRDARSVLAAIRSDRTARRFGAAVSLLSVVFFMFSSGMLYVFPDDGVGISLSERIVTTIPVADPLVLWPAVEFWFPRVPIGGMVSVGTAILIAVFGGLIGLNAALFALQRSGPTPGGASGTTAGVAGIAAPQACCCCGPMLSQVAVVTLGPSAAAPIYLLFADPSSSIGSLFFVASVAILTGTLVYAARERSRSDPEGRAVRSGQTS